MFEHIPRCDEEDADFYFIYALINKKNGKIYIGKTKSPRDRIRNHYYYLKRGIHTNRELQNDFEDGFEFQILESKIIWRNSVSKEREYMLKFKTYDSEYGYNSKDTYFMRNGKPTKYAIKNAT